MDDTSSCLCFSPDTAAAMATIRKSPSVAQLHDDSHFIVTLRRCDACGGQFLSLFCERVDWADGDDPQTRVMVPVNPEEAAQLRALAPFDEGHAMRILSGTRRFLYHDMPKGAGETLEWRTGAFFIPAHD
jgi:hypothetical protein